MTLYFRSVSNIIDAQSLYKFMVSISKQFVFTVHIKSGLYLVSAK